MTVQFILLLVGKACCCCFHCNISAVAPSTAICNSNSLRPGLQILTNKDACKISLVPPPQTCKGAMSQSQAH